MRQLKHLALATLMVLIIGTGIVVAGELATKEECVQKCAEVAKIINSKGVEAAVKEVNDASGQFIWKDTYVYLMNLEGTIVAHGPQPKFIGKNLMGLKDPILKKAWYPALFAKIKAGSNSGWFLYHWKKPNAKGLYKKDCYYQRAGNLVIFAGIYGDKI